MNSEKVIENILVTDCGLDLSMIVTYSLYYGLNEMQYRLSLMRGGGKRILPIKKPEIHAYEKKYCSKKSKVRFIALAFIKNYNLDKVVMGRGFRRKDAEKVKNKYNKTATTASCASTG